MKRRRRPRRKEDAEKKIMNPWQEAGSKGLDTWYESSAAYAVTEGHPELRGSYDYRPSSMEASLAASPKSEKRQGEGYYAILKRIIPPIS